MATRTNERKDFLNSKAYYGDSGNLYIIKAGNTTLGRFTGANQSEAIGKAAKKFPKYYNLTAKKV